MSIDRKIWHVSNIFHAEKVFDRWDADFGGFLFWDTDINYFDVCALSNSAGTVFWKFDEVQGMEEPTGLRNSSNTFTDSNMAAYGKRLSNS